MSCWICRSQNLENFNTNFFIESSSISITSDDFKITDSNYGKTLPLDKCLKCGFIQIKSKIDLNLLYSKMKDEDYKATEDSRRLQSKKILKLLMDIKGKNILDIGAGTGLLVDEAAKLGANSIGIDLSKWLVQQGQKEGRNLILGTIPNDNLKNLSFDYITIIDVIEHVDNPRELVEHCIKLLAPNGKMIIVTPDHGSITRKLFKNRWWHYRLAHIGYFDLNSFYELTKQLDLTVEKVTRPKWYFPFHYLFQRLSKYLPIIKLIKLPRSIQNIIIPLNLFDSWLFVIKKSNKKS